MMHTAQPLSGSFLLQSHGATHAGRVREDNQDDYLRRDDAGLWAVADGVGGLSDGREASRSVIAALDALPAAGNLHVMADALTQAVANANLSLLNLAAARNAQLGTTLVALLMRADTFICAWAGDSRLYCLRDGRLTQITRDHNEANALVDSGVLAPEEALTWPRRNVITRAIGVDAQMTLDFREGTVREGDIFLLCSDGLTAHLTDADIRAHLRGQPLDTMPDALIQTALQRGGTDNITVIVISVHRMASRMDREKTVTMITRKAPHG